MDEIDVDFCFYDDVDYTTDADRDSRLLRAWHQRLWSKTLPGGEMLAWQPETGSMVLAYGDLRVSSDTIATAHATYARHGMPPLWSQLPEAARSAYQRAFYTIGGFIVFPVRPQSLNQRRGTAWSVADRFDLTLECIRRHYLGRDDSPLADTLEVDSAFFGMFGTGRAGFEAYVEFFLLQDLASSNGINWFDGRDLDEWTFDDPPLPATLESYRRYLDGVARFVAARNRRIRAWCDLHARGERVAD